ncbi:MAG: VWA domain-containing protein [Bacteroidota bacterium]|nr:VWA domain-containing protein [Bacteroidota bacterium]MDP4236626.1 VWA domain-containing protein [Bacteroidota bacterium]
MAITAIPGDTAYVRIGTKKGHVIRNLVADDFLITRDDDTAEIISCTRSTNSPATDLAITFILDNSGSMFHSYDSLTRYLDRFLDSLGKGFTANAMAFDNIERKRTFDGTERENLYIASSGFTDDKRELKDFWHSYDSIRTDLTPLYETIIKGLLRISDRRKAGDSLRREVMLVITDGADNASSASIEQLSELAAAMPVSIYTVNFRSDPDGRLLWLSRKTHGDHYIAEDLGELQKVLDFLRVDIASSYRIVFQFPFRGASGGH